MAVQVLADVTCDQCPRSVEIDIDKIGYARTVIEIKLKNLGWFVEGDTHYCPECKECDDED